MATKRNIAKNGAGAAKTTRKRVKNAVPKDLRQAKKDARIQRFVREYLVDLNGRQAAIRAGFSPSNARFEASRLLAEADVQAAIQKAMDERGQRTGITADKVLERIWGIATADPRELMEFRRACCRYCWGRKHLYQYTPSEMREAIAQFERDRLAAIAGGGKHSAQFDEAGGIGFDPRKDPNPDCPECFGEGVERVFPKDTRDLSPAARLLYAGVKTTQHGLEIKTHDQTGMLIKAGEHLGLFKQRIEHTGKDGKDLATGVVVVPAKLPEKLDEPHALPTLADSEPGPVEPAAFAVKSAG